MSAENASRRVILPMTSIVDGAPGSSEAQPLVFYLTVLGEQALIALRHLLAIWEVEGDSGDLEVWNQRESIDETLVWSHLQGAMFAGVIVARMLDPRVQKPSKRASGAQRELQKRKQEVADERSVRLCELLEIDKDSPLLQIRKIRDAIEHFDEKIDELVIAGDVASVSDFHISAGACFAEVPAEGLPGHGGYRHVTMRQFAPDIGILFFGSEAIDLFAYETALHNLLAKLPEAFDDALAGSESGARYGASRLVHWPGTAAARRQAIHAVRDEVRRDGKWLLRPESRPRTIVSVWDLNQAEVNAQTNSS